MDSKSSNQPIPSRHQLGDVVLFEPRITKIDGRAGTTTDPDNATRAKVVGIAFTDGKVLYDLAVATDDEEEPWYAAQPLRGVDSYMVVPSNAPR